MANTKLLKVMDYLINEQEDKARELLHQIFIEKARAIHEEMMAHDDMDEDMMGGDKGERLASDIESDMNEIEAEEYHGPSTMEAADEELDVEDAEEDLSDELEDMDDMEDVEDADDMSDMEDMGDEDLEGDEEDITQVDMEEPEMGGEDESEKIHDLEQAIAELKAEFEALKHETEGGNQGEDSHEDEDKMAESWESDTDDLEEEYDDLAENVDLETVHAAKGGEVGAGKFAPSETNTRSPVPSTQTDMMGARPVKTGQGPKASGYDRQSAPEHKSMGLTNRRKDADQGKHPVSKEGDSAALLNKGTSAGYGAVNTRSPISGRK
jgi:hypothetical protein